MNAILRRSRPVAVLITVVALTAVLAACGSDDNGGSSTGDTSPGGLSGTIKVDGSSTVAPLTGAAVELFNEDSPDVQIPVGTSGTGGGFKKFCAGETDMSDASRPIKDDDPGEKPACDKNGITYEEIQVANDGIALVVNKDNTWAKCLTVEQLKKIWEPAAQGKIENWNQVDPSFPDQKLALFGAGTASGTFDFFTAEINGEEDSSRSDYNATEDDNVTVQGVEGDKGALGYFGLSYYEENKDKMSVVKVDAGDGCVEPTTATVQDGSYKPLSRPLFIYPSNKLLARPEGLAFVKFYVDNSGDIATDALFVPMTAEQQAESVAEVDKLAGLRFSDDDNLTREVMAAITSPLRPEPRTLRGSGLVRRRGRIGERIIVGVFGACAFVSIAITVGIVASLVSPTVQFFGDVSIVDFLTGTTWAPLFNPPSFGVLAIVAGTLVTTVCALVVCLPFGLGAAIYLSEYARPRARRIIKPVLEVLAGIPTVVYGYFAVRFVSPYVQDLWPFGSRPGSFNALCAGLVMGIMIMPTVVSLSEDALAAVPLELRQGTYTLGSSGYEVATKVTVPAALSGIVASFVLGVSRAIGETMIVLIAAGGTPNFTWNPGEAMMTMTSFIAQAATGDLPQGSIGYKTIFAVGALLFVITFTLNYVSNRVVRRYREAYE